MRGCRSFRRRSILYPSTSLGSILQQSSCAIDVILHDFEETVSLHSFVVLLKVFLARRVCLRDGSKIFILVLWIATLLP